jgi:phenol 2-monooxygenase (NADPH)
MQFYLNGYKPGDPFVEDPHPSVAVRPGASPRRPMS